MADKKYTQTSLRSRLETQGYRGYCDADLDGFKPGIRFAYYACISLVILGLLLTNITILGAAFLIALIGSFPPRHPFDYIYNAAIRHWLGKPEMPLRSKQSRFACRIATVWLGVTIYLFYSGLDMWGYILGIGLVIVGLLVATADICIPSIIYNFLFERQKNEE